MEPKPLRPLGWILIIGGLLLVPMLAYFGLWGLGAFLIEADPLRKADVIVVLSGDTDRLAQAARLWREGYGEWLIVTAVPGSSPTDEVRSAGLPMERILFSGTLVSSTRDEALVARDLMLKKNLKTCLVVTDPFHTQRARWIFIDVFKASGLEARVYPVQNHWYRSQTWWRSAEGWQVTLQEYVKLVVYWIGFRID